VITVSSTAGDGLWWKLKLLDSIDIPMRKGGIDFDGQSLLLMQRRNLSSVSHLSKDTNDVLTDLIRVQWRIKEMLPQTLSSLLGRYEKYVISFAGVVQSYAVLRIAFKPRWVLLVAKGLAALVGCLSLRVGEKGTKLTDASSLQTVNGWMSCQRTCVVSPSS